MQNPNLFNIPHDTLGEILSHLDIKSIIRLINCSKSTQALFTAPNTCIWETFMNLKGLGEEQSNISNTVDFVIKHFIVNVVNNPFITLDHHLKYTLYDKLEQRNTLHRMVIAVSKIVSDNKQEICKTTISDSIKFVKNKLPNFLHEYIYDFYFNYSMIMKFGDINEKSKIILANDELYITSKKYAIKSHNKQNELTYSIHKILKATWDQPSNNSNFLKKWSDYPSRRGPVGDHDSHQHKTVQDFDDLFEYIKIKEKLLKNPTPKNRSRALSFSVAFLEYIYNPTDDEIKMYLDDYPIIIGYAINPSEKLQLKALKYMTNKIHKIPMLRFIKNPTPLVIKTAIENDTKNADFVSFNILFDVYKNSKSHVILELLLDSQNKSLRQQVEQYVENNYSEQIIEHLNTFWPGLVKIMLKHEPSKIIKMDDHLLTKEIFDYFAVNPKNIVLLIKNKSDCRVVRENITEEHALQAISEDINVIRFMFNSFDFFGVRKIDPEYWILEQLDKVLQKHEDLSFLDFIDIKCVSLISLLIRKPCGNNDNFEPKLEAINLSECVEKTINEILKNPHYYKKIENKIKNIINDLRRRMMPTMESSVLKNEIFSNFIIELRKKVINDYPLLVVHTIKNIKYPQDFANSNDLIEMITGVIKKYPELCFILEKIPDDLEMLLTVVSKKLMKHKINNKEAQLLHSLLYDSFDYKFTQVKKPNISKKLNKEQSKTAVLLHPWKFSSDNKNCFYMKNLKINNKFLTRFLPEEETEKNKNYIRPSMWSRSIASSIDFYGSNAILNQEQFQKLDKNEKEFRIDLINKLKSNNSNNSNNSDNSDNSNNSNNSDNSDNSNEIVESE